MKNKIAGLFLMIIVVLVNLNIPVHAKEMPDELKNLYARSAVLMDADSGRILFGRNESDILPMASTTKIMTCILALEHMEENEIGVVSEYAKKQPKVHLGVQVGEKYYIKDLLYSLMLESHNDSAVIIAESIAGTVNKFADMMNQKAKKIGCINTYFITPNGLDAEDKIGKHTTTAKDLALIMRYCIQESPVKETFLKITQTDNYQFTDLNGNRSHTCHNHNSLLKMMEGAISGKTGYTNDAGYCYVGVVRKDNRTFIVSLLACGWPNNKNYKWQDTRKLVEYGIKNYICRTINHDNEKYKIRVDKAMNTDNPLMKNIFVEAKIVSSEEEATILIHKDEKLDIKVVKEKQLKAPVEKGQIIGAVFYMIDEDILLKQNIITVSSVESKNFKKYIGYIMYLYLGQNLRKV